MLQDGIYAIKFREFLLYITFHQIAEAKSGRKFHHKLSVRLTIIAFLNLISELFNVPKVLKSFGLLFKIRVDIFVGEGQDWCKNLEYFFADAIYSPVIFIDVRVKCGFRRKFAILQLFRIIDSI